LRLSAGAVLREVGEGKAGSARGDVSLDAHSSSREGVGG
jgi:hypothetical protein